MRTTTATMQNAGSAMASRKRAVLLSTVAIASCVFGTPALAQDERPAGNALGEIVVTAQKREQSLLDVPAAVSAFGGDNLDALRIVNTTAITTLVPNFNVTYERGPNSIPNFTLRGVRGDSLASRLNESSVALYSNEVFLGDESSLNGSIYDLERVEVLRGPQGTVFGKNTTGGLVHFISATPTRDFSGYMNLETGSGHAFNVEGAVSGPISDTIRVRLAGRHAGNDGITKNRYLLAGTGGVEKYNGDQNVYGLRGTVDIDLSEKTLLRIIGVYAHDNSQPTPGITYGTLLPGTTGPGPYTRAQMCDVSRINAARDCISDVQATNPAALPVIGREANSGITNLTPADLKLRGRGRSITANLTHDFEWATLTSVTNYSKNNYTMRFDADAGATPSPGIGFNYVADYTNKSEQFSQELRLNGATDSFDWVTGLFYYKDKKHSVQEVDLRSIGAALFTVGGLKSESYAMFGQLDAHLSEQVTLSIGARYTKEVRELTEASTYTTGVIAVPFQDVFAALPDPRSNNKDFTGKFSLNWQPNDDNTFYLSYSRGIKGAGFNTGYSPLASLQSNVDLTGPVGQEVLDAFEIGSKNRFLDDTLSINSAAFYYDFKGKQEQLFAVDSLGRPQQNYINVGNARIYGIETEILYRPSPMLDLSFSGGWLNAKIVKSDVVVQNSFGERIALEGLPLSDTPKWSFFTYAAFHVPIERAGEFTIQPEARAVGKKNYSLTEDPLSIDKSHVFVNLRLLWKSEDDKYNAQVFVTNLFDRISFDRNRDVVIGSAGKLNASEGQGRLWGAKLGVNF